MKRFASLWRCLPRRRYASFAVSHPLTCSTQTGGVMNSSPPSLRRAALALPLAMLLLVFGCARPDPSEQLKPLIDRYVRVWNTGDFSGIEEVVSTQFELRMSPQFTPVRSLDSLKSIITSWRTAYPDFHISLEELIYTPTVVAARWTIRATNTGPGSHPPTGKAIVIPGISILHVSEGKLIDEWIAEAE